MPGKYMDEKEVPPTFWQRVRPWVYGFSFALIFAMTGVELGIDAHIINNHGNLAEDYPSLEFKNIVGLILFSCIGTLLYVVAHPWSGIRMSTFWAFVFTVFWGTAAGVLNRVVPFEAFNCGNPRDTFPTQWQPWAHQCRELVTFQAFAWSLWGFFMFHWLGLMAEVFELKFKPKPAPFYRHRYFDTV
ncbi:uncharacterized protein PHACADRAFT_247092 [Phanerochaete carnosa HHB-10118-sp]|uniref:MARVEL domain-containing protein n=1 Tax=Phanerochaete carnosa (strain HHB-10118-sp) TaxID=650164 RepID=K5WNV9_PHACS|nr:uncharacterized protein PHACADRAFT_247092 [Phanerochaete carnosa HHB-10118-sp]EKM60879.1 hypothetical protein PHACADRAFT_247092 [Phanerochaete carnosa HHB-10118-sp]